MKLGLVGLFLAVMSNAAIAQGAAAAVGKILSGAVKGETLYRGAMVGSIAGRNLLNNSRGSSSTNQDDANHSMNIGLNPLLPRFNFQRNGNDCAGSNMRLIDPALDKWCKDLEKQWQAGANPNKDSHKTEGKKDKAKRIAERDKLLAKIDRETPLPKTKATDFGAKLDAEFLSTRVTEPTYRAAKDRLQSNSVVGVSAVEPGKWAVSDGSVAGNGRPNLTSFVLADTEEEALRLANRNHQNQLESDKRTVDQYEKSQPTSPIPNEKPLVESSPLDPQLYVAPRRFD